MDVKTTFLSGDIDETIYIMKSKKLCVRRPNEDGLKIDNIYLWAKTCASSVSYAEIIPKRRN